MPIRPPPMTLRCTKCGWHTHWQPRGDALTSGDLPPTACPTCGSDALDVQEDVGIWHKLTAQVGRIFHGR